MQNPSTATTHESASSASGFFTRLTGLASLNRSPSSNPDGFSLSTSNALFFNGSRTLPARRTTRKALASLSLNAKSSAGSSLRRFISEFNSFIRFHCDKVVPESFASVGVSRDESGVRESEAGGVLGEEGSPLSGVEADGPKKVLILMSDTGGGHRASAEAIKAAFNQEFGDEYQVFITDLWTDHTPWPFNQLPRSYNFLVKHGTLWKMTYYGTAPRVIHQSNFAATSTFIAREIAQGLMKYQPDIIISVHPLMQHVPLRVLRSKGLLDKIVFTTVITDLSTCHPTWFHKLVTRCYCPSTEVVKRAQKAGLKTSQIKVYGLPVRPSFVKPVRPKVDLRRELGMDENLPAVLLMGGGEGMGPIEATARALGDALYDESLGEAVGQVLIICGRNKKLQTRLSSLDWKIPVQVKGFITKMEECMGACDCIITKAGPGTIAEAMIRGLPIILNGYIAGQEAGNVPYVVENGCGEFSKSPIEISKIVAEWFEPRSRQLEIMSQNALRLARPEAVFILSLPLSQRSEEMARKKIREYDSKRLVKEHFKRLSGKELPIRSVQINQETDLNELVEKEPWLSSEKLVVKPDMLFGKRGKSGLVALKLDFAEVATFVKDRLGKEVEMSGCKGPITTFIVEPFVPHTEEFYLNIVSDRLGCSISFSECGGIDIEENWDKVKTITVPTGSSLTPEICAPLVATLPLEIKGELEDFIQVIFTLFQDLDFTFLEMNPFALVDGKPYPLDMRGELDDTAAFKNFKKWGDIEFPMPFGRVMSPTESFIHGLDEKTSASLKFTVLNPKGRIWTMVAGGGASVIYADTVGDLGYASELGNYAEYSGAPKEDEVLQYARVVIDCATANPDGKTRALVIGGGIANFTDVAATFNGIIRALKEKEAKLKAARMHIYVRRGGPNYQKGLAKMRSLGDEIGVPIEVYGPEATMTGICKEAIEYITAAA